MSQNIYDTPEFFAGYSQLRRSRVGLNGAPEWRRLQTLLPGLQGARVVDLGCGMGWYARWFREHGAASVLAIDISQNMLDRAAEMTNDDGITYQRRDLDDLAVQHELLPDAAASTVDLAFSALAVHYLASLPQLVARVHRVLKPGGVFVFSAEHPITSAVGILGTVEVTVPDTRVEGGQPTARRVWPLRDYQIEGVRYSKWLADGVRKYHRTTATYINMLLDAGFELTGFNEWVATEEEIQAHPEWLVDHPNEVMKPTFLLMRATKKL